MAKLQQRQRYYMGTRVVQFIRYALKLFVFLETCLSCYVSSFQNSMNLQQSSVKLFRDKNEGKLSVGACSGIFTILQTDVSAAYIITKLKIQNNEIN